MKIQNAIKAICFSVFGIWPSFLTECSAAEILMEDRYFSPVFKNSYSIGSVAAVNNEKPSDSKRILITISCQADLIDSLESLSKPAYTIDLHDSDLKISHLAKLADQNLRIVSLDVSENPIGKEGSKIISRIQSIERLIVRACTLYDEGIEPIAALSHLNSLDINYNGISADGIKFLTRLPLEELDVGSNYIKNEGVKLLAQFSKLRVANLAMNDLDDECLDDLLGIASLKYLDISGNKFTQFGIERLAKEARERSFQLIS